MEVYRDPLASASQGLGNALLPVPSHVYRSAFSEDIYKKVTHDNIGQIGRRKRTVWQDTQVWDQQRLGVAGKA